MQISSIPQPLFKTNNPIRRLTKLKQRVKVRPIPITGYIVILIISKEYKRLLKKNMHINYFETFKNTSMLGYFLQ